MTAPDDRDIERANARMLDAYRQADALRVRLTEVERERDAIEAASIEYYADRDRFKHELEGERAHVARLVREVQEMAARVDEMRAERDAAKAARPPDGRDPVVRLPVVPAVPTACCWCAHEQASYCHHPLQLCREPVERSKAPPTWCKMRREVELAKAGAL